MVWSDYGSSLPVAHLLAREVVRASKGVVDFPPLVRLKPPI